MILSDVQIRDALRTGRIELRYAFLPSGGEKVVALRHSVSPVERNEAVRAAFERALTRNRVAVSLGPLVKPLRGWRRVEKKTRFGDHSQLVDLRTRRQSGWPLAPGEAAVAFSNEWLRLSSDIVGFVYGRVSTQNNGLVVASTYLDSTWEGLIKLHIINTSGHTVRLHLGMELARLFLAAADPGSTDDHAVARQGVHYGLTWSRIIDDSIDPFPVSAMQRENGRLVALRSTSEWLKEYAGYGLLGLLAAGAAGGVQLYTKLAEPLELVPKVAQLQSDVSGVRSQQPLSGVETVHIRAGTSSSQVLVDLPQTLHLGSGTAYIVANTQGAGPAVPVRSELRSSGGRLRLVLTVVLTQPSATDVDVNVEWLIVP